MNPDVSLDEYLTAFRGDAERLAVCAENGDLGASVTACPDWDLRELLMHIGGIHRWAGHAIVHAAPPTAFDDARPGPDAPGDEIAAWLRTGGESLVAALASTPLDADTWHPFPAEQKAWVWARRQAMETMMHRWDAELAASGESSLDAKLAAVGLAEFFDLLLPRLLERERAEVPDASLHLHCTDDGLPEGAGEWIVWGDDGTYQMESVHRHGDAALRGSSTDLLLVMMRRADLSTVELRGDQAAVDAWFALPGF